jgi:hypothetical protein
MARALEASVWLMNGSCLYLSDSRRMVDSILPFVVLGEGVQGKGGCFPFPCPAMC